MERNMSGSWCDGITTRTSDFGYFGERSFICEGNLSSTLHTTHHCNPLFTGNHRIWLTSYIHHLLLLNWSPKIGTNPPNSIITRDWASLNYLLKSRPHTTTHNVFLSLSIHIRDFFEKRASIQSDIRDKSTQGVNNRPLAILAPTQIPTFITSTGALSLWLSPSQTLYNSLLQSHCHYLLCILKWH